MDLHPDKHNRWNGGLRPYPRRWRIPNGIGIISESSGYHFGMDVEQSDDLILRADARCESPSEPDVEPRTP
jgi:hypothetical protein